jgi:hypothetical protein
MPAMFLRKRTVPAAPISLVKFSSSEPLVDDGFGQLTPISDQVPELM